MAVKVLIIIIIIIIIIMLIIINKKATRKKIRNFSPILKKEISIFCARGLITELRSKADKSSLYSERLFY